MIATLDLRGVACDSRTVTHLLPRAAIDVAGALDVVRPLIDEVRALGETALLRQAEQFDGVRPASVRIDPDLARQALDTLDPRVRAGLEVAIDRVGQVHRAQVPPQHVTTLGEGACVTQRWAPVQRVGLYVPGGLAVYPSSVVMNAVAAQAAGVSDIALASPAQRDHGGLPHPTVLATCALLGITEIYAAGGAGAIAMFAYGAAGTHTQRLCAPVDVITGPGNVYVAAAKRLVRGVVGIDAEAGPTEIMVLADDTANPAWVAADLISQAEHDPLAASVLVTPSPRLAQQVCAEMEAQVAETPHRERVTQALSGPQSAAVLVDSMDAGVAVANAYGAEHLEIITRDAAGVSRQISNAGAIFLGPYSPVPLGDYLAGSNHVLPTGGTARFSAALSVMSFLRSVQVIEYTQAALADVGGHIIALAAAEDLPAHGRAIEARIGIDRPTGGQL